MFFIKIENNTIKCDRNLKILGITFDERLRFYDHFRKKIRWLKVFKVEDIFYSFLLRKSYVNRFLVYSQVLQFSSLRLPEKSEYLLSLYLQLREIFFRPQILSILKEKLICSLHSINIRNKNTQYTSKLIFDVSAIFYL